MPVSPGGAQRGANRWEAKSAPHSQGGFGPALKRWITRIAAPRIGKQPARDDHQPGGAPVTKGHQLHQPRVVVTKITSTGAPLRITSSLSPFSLLGLPQRKKWKPPSHSAAQRRLTGQTTSVSILQQSNTRGKGPLPGLRAKPV